MLNGISVFSKSAFSSMPRSDKDVGEYKRKSIKNKEKNSTIGRSVAYLFHPLQSSQ